MAKTVEYQNIYKSAIKVFGKENQMRQAQEECAELIHAISKYMRMDRQPEYNDTWNNKEINDLYGEMADVEIMLEQLKEIFPSDKFEKIKQAKLKRLQRLIEQEVGD